MEYKKSQSLSEQVADEILDMIVVKKQFKIGDKLPNETELSALLNVSRTTLREAIKMLVLQDIVEIKRGKGTFVKSDEVDNFTLGNLKPNTYEGISADYKQGDKRKCNFIKTIRKSDRTYIKRSPNDNRFYERKKCRRGKNCDEFTHYTYNW